MNGIILKKTYQYDNDNVERDAVVRQLQQDLADTSKKKKSTIEASLEVETCHHMLL